MCELFGISSRHPTTARFSLSEFARRGGDTGPHSDGWGITFLRDGDVALMREAEPSAGSPLLQLIHEQHTPSELVIAHIRKATQGIVSLRNTQPFVRELGGRPHVFAHNGDLGELRQRISLEESYFRPIGDTDSEHAFCHLLSKLQTLWLGGDTPSLDQRLRVFTRFATYMTTLGTANFLYSDSEFLFVHSHYRREDGDELAHPGIYLLERNCHEYHIKHGGTVDPDQQMTLLASRPLSQENWQPLPSHSVLVIQNGRVIIDHPLPERTLKAQ